MYTFVTSRCRDESVVLHPVLSLAMKRILLLRGVSKPKNEDLRPKTKDLEIN